MTTDPGRVEVLFAGGGTAGHVVPGLSVAAALVAAGRPADQIGFLGSHGIENDLVPAAGYALETVPGRGIPRTVSVAAVRAIASNLVGTFRGIGVVRRLHPKVLVALGGYAAGPGIIGAIIWRVPIVVLARDARVGFADRLAGRFAKACAVPFPGTDLPRAVVTGSPLRPEILAVTHAADRNRTCEALDIPPGRTVVAVFTGSLGSRRVNEAVRDLVATWADRDDLAVYHVIGRRDWDDWQANVPAPPADGLWYRCVAYEDHMEQLLAAADVAVTRAGGATVAELAQLGLPAVMVPLPIATGDHQRYNAQALVDVGGGVLVLDDDCDGARLVAELQPLVDDAATRARMSAAAATLARPDAAEAVAALIEEHARP
jgi:UDP-N-acetylglucosamine--N-acetylmuramyl-(pentapeptide) pyrophosphoryl-undecaprenol N-acetylglucosamine transferase